MGNRVKYFVVLIVILVNFPVTVSAMFKDVSTTHWAFSSIKWATERKVTTGYPDGNFLPQNSVSEAEFITMLMRLDCTVNLQRLTAVRQGEHWASANYRYLQEKNFPLLGYADVKKRDEPIRRGQVAQLMAAFNGLDLSEQYAVYYLYLNNLSNGMTGKKTYRDFNSNNSLSRAEAVVFIERMFRHSGCRNWGLQTLPTGKDDFIYDPLPINFLLDDLIVFPTPPSSGQFPTPGEGRDILVDYEKEKLIANGEDSTFITLMINDCLGRQIDEEVELHFRVSSKHGANLNRTFGNEFTSELPRIFTYHGENEFLQPEPGFSAANYRQNTVNTFTDGPDLSVEVTAPRVNQSVEDILTFQYMDTRRFASYDFSCYQEGIQVPIKYEPQAELRVEVNQPELVANGASNTTVSATIYRPGGERIYNYSGTVRFTSTRGGRLSSVNAPFFNGRAQTTLTSINTSNMVVDTINAEIVTSDIRYNEVQSLVGKKHSVEVVYQPRFITPVDCILGDVEIGFVIDSSGSMKRNDPHRMRVTKSKELVNFFTNNSRYLAADFNSRSRLLSNFTTFKGNVRSSIDQVREVGGTNIGAGLDEAISRFNGSANQKIIILLTDGRSNRAKAIQAKNRAKQKGIKIFTVGLGEKNRLDEGLLKEIAQDTGGRYFHVANGYEIGIAYQQIIDTISCGTSGGGCLNPASVFDQASVTRDGAFFYASTFIRDECQTDIERVAIMFRAPEGDLIYDLIHRGHSYYELKKPRNELANIDLYHEIIILAFDRNGNEIARRGGLAF